MRALCMGMLAKLLLAVALLAMLTGAFALTVLASLNVAGQAEIRQRSNDERQTYLLYLRPEHLLRGTEARGMADDGDVAALAEAVPQVDVIALWERRNLTGVELGENRYPQPGATHIMTPMLGRVKPTIKEVMRFIVAEGRFINAEDLQHSRRVAVIGAGLHRRLGGGQVIGQELTTKVLEWDGTHRSRVSRIFTIVGLLCAELPLLGALPLCDAARRDLLPRLIDRPRAELAPDGRAFQALQREQLVMSRLATNETVFIPWTSDCGPAELTPNTLVYLRVSTPNVPGSQRLMVDQETMTGLSSPDPCEECEAPCRACDPPVFLMPKGLLEVADEIRAVLRSRLGNDRLFQFMHMETVGDDIRFELRWLNRLLGAIIVPGLLLCPIALMAGVAVLRRTMNGREPASAEEQPREGGPRPNTLSGYTRICVLAVAASVIAGGMLSYWLVTRVLLW